MLSQAPEHRADPRLVLYTIMAIWFFLRRKTEWGDMERKGFDEEAVGFR